MLTTNVLTKDLGRLKYGRPTTFNFQVKNEGPRTLKIDKLTVGCGSCTKARILKTSIAPDEEVLIEATFTPGSIGPQTKHITIRYDNDQVLQLQFTADVHT